MKFRCQSHEFAHANSSRELEYAKYMSLASSRFEQLQARNTRQPCCLPAVRPRPLHPRNHFEAHCMLVSRPFNSSTFVPVQCPEKLRPEINTRTLLSPRTSLRKILLSSSG
jgi:hypothetical protein